MFLKSAPVLGFSCFAVLVLLKSVLLRLFYSILMVPTTIAKTGDFIFRNFERFVFLIVGNGDITASISRFFESLANDALLFCCNNKGPVPLNKLA